MGTATPGSERAADMWGAAFLANAVWGIGGQGEFLRQMALALDPIPGARVYCRRGRPDHVRDVALPFRPGVRRLAFSLLRGTPVLRRRVDWLTLLADVDFDRRVARRLGAVGLDLVDGVMGQCRLTFERARPRARALVLTSLNTHIDHLASVLEAEHRRIGFTGPSFIHPRMRRRALREIALADWVRVTSDLARRTFVERGSRADRVVVIRPAVDLDHFRPQPVGAGPFRVMAVSSIEPRKGIHYLLQAFADAALPDAELVLVGGTGDRWSRRMVARYARQDRVRIAFADVTRAPVTDTYGTASVVVHPALEDGYGLVIAQALASGRPVVASRGAGASELVQHGVNGFLVEPGSARGIADALRALAGDRALLAKMSAAAPAAVRGLGYPEFGRQVRRFYRTVLTGADAA